ncbi:HIT domain-containing protein [bacterium endosymbiont of Pedicinus badii]|uniref:HIT domain-containing protein n=1 Tax=bacterium endosymbiont of Pedicinus badii TaxID=1719126 RepID=UPI0009BB52AC|nr:HIT domain-containing protein [bacterium endosymbiont of Pedicinus badii]OQM34508.1 purine nucleoside phosphoramidase [bacterium endosymbiont of Pedicinus badii]
MKNSKKSVFLEIISKKSSKILYQDNYVTAFRDINPKAPVHILIVSNELIPTLNNIKSRHKNLFSSFFLAAKKIAKKEKISDSGYRIVINCNKDAGQEIYHLHMHLLGGKKLKKI